MTIGVGDRDNHFCDILHTMEPTENNKENMFAELAKVKGKPAPIATEYDAPLTFDDEGDGELTIDLFQTKDDVVMQSAIAGVDIDDLEINITSEAVTIRGRREKTETVSEKDYFYQECFWGSFSRSIVLPAEVDADKSSAKLTKGVLTIRMPKVTRAKTKKVKVKASDI